MIPTQLERTYTIRAVSKSQIVRIADIFWIGPLMIYGALKIKDPFHRASLLVFGISTIVYNARNYLENKSRIAANENIREF